MIYMDVCVVGTTHKLAFNDIDSATIALEGLRAKLNEDKWAKNEKRGNVHTILTPAGPFDAVLDQVLSARLIDLEVWESQTRLDDERINKIKADTDLAHRRAILELEREFGVPSTDQHKSK